MTRGFTLALALALAGPAALPSQSTQTAARRPAAAPPVLTLTISDSSLQAPATTVAGLVTVRLTNRGRQPHQVQIVQIGNGHEASEARTYLLANKELPNWTQSVAGIGPARPGQTATVTMVLRPGEFLLVDALLDPRGQPNFKHGVVASIRISGDVVRDLPNIPAVAGLALSDRLAKFGNLQRSGDTYRLLEGRDRMTAVPRGDAVLRVEGQGSTHTIVLMRGDPGAMRVYTKWLTGHGPAPEGIISGDPVLTPLTGRIFLHVKLETGSYMIFCPAVHPRTGMRGYETGEFAQFIAR